MYKTSVMLKNKLRNKHNIVSRVFDTINKMTDEVEQKDEDAASEEKYETIATVTNNYSVSLPSAKIHANTKPFLICIYQVRTDGLYPFLLFLLNIVDIWEANFIHMPAIRGGYKKIKYAALTYAKSILPEVNISYAGFYELTAQNIIILNCSERTPEMYTSPEYIWTTSFEIINKRKIGHTPIHNNVLDFFIENPSFLTLKTSDQRIYESPMIGYAKVDTNACSTEELDIYRETLLPELGKCYYLYTTIPYMKESHLLRVAFFAGEMVVYGDVCDKKNIESMLCKNHGRYMIEHYKQLTLLAVVNIKGLNRDLI